MPRLFSTLVALAFVVLAPTPSLADGFFSWLRDKGGQGVCPRGIQEHRVDWMAFAGADADPAGVPRRVEGRLPSVALGGDTIHLQYGGLTRRFDFDSPRAQPAPNLPNGFFRIDYDLLQFEEFAEIHLNLPRAMDRFTLVFGGVDSSARADSGVRDAVWVEATTPDGRRIAPGYFYPTMHPADSNARVRDQAQRDGFGAPWITGYGVSALRSVRHAASDPVGAAFREPVRSITIRLSGLPLDGGGGWAHGAATNPPAQRVDILSGAYCG